MAGAVLDVAGAQSVSVTTGESGRYALEKLSAGGAYTITPSKPAYEFDPPSATLGPLADNLSKDFKATVQTYEVSGTVRDSSGVPLSGVTITLDGAQKQRAESNASGKYTFSNVSGARSYTISPDKSGYTFIPQSMPVVYLANSLAHTFYGSASADRDKPPSQWTVLNEYSKTIITLASGLLAVTVTFSSQLISKSSDSTSNFLLIATWVVLVSSIIFGVLTAAYIIQYLRNNREGGKAITFANLSYLTLVLAGGLFLSFGIYVISSDKTWDAVTSIEQALKKMPSLAGTGESKWVIQSMQWDENSKTYQLLITGDRTAERFAVTVDPAKNNITKFEKSQ